MNMKLHFVFFNDKEKKTATETNVKPIYEVFVLKIQYFRIKKFRWASSPRATLSFY